MKFGVESHFFAKANQRTRRFASDGYSNVDGKRIRACISQKSSHPTKALLRTTARTFMGRRIQIISRNQQPSRMRGINREATAKSWLIACLGNGLVESPPT